MKTTARFLCLLGALAACSFPALRAENLGDLLEQADLGALIGTWVDQDTKGESVTVTYAWRIRNHALGMSVKTPNRTSEALIGMNPKTGEVVHVSLDDQGGAGRGTWGEEDGLATLTLNVVNAEGEEMKMKVTHKIIDNKELVVTMKNVDTDQGGEITLVRKPE